MAHQPSLGVRASSFGGRVGKCGAAEFSYPPSLKFQMRWPSSVTELVEVSMPNYFCIFYYYLSPIKHLNFFHHTSNPHYFS